MKALQPARVKEVRIDEEARTAEVIVPDFQLSLAIGKEGQNARLATRLSGLRIDIRSETEIAEQEAYERTYGTDAYAEGAWIVDSESGEQMWQPSDGSPAWTLEQWEAAQAEADVEAVEEAVGEVKRAMARLDEVYAAYADPDADFDKLAREQGEDHHGGSDDEPRSLGEAGGERTETFVDQCVRRVEDRRHRQRPRHHQQKSEEADCAHEHRRLHAVRRTP